MIRQLPPQPQPQQPRLPTLVHALAWLEDDRAPLSTDELAYVIRVSATVSVAPHRLAQVTDHIVAAILELQRLADGAADGEEAIGQ